MSVKASNCTFHERCDFKNLVADLNCMSAVPALKKLGENDRASRCFLPEENMKNLKEIIA